ncbi:MAG: hypothetical protein CVV50_00365 [Spirochaetae bacterium HGW-Spirochaetae-6]|nr:MAG: hypothetical protein CVV50_00365 [Spirochaetae bacterium HGW-Spirochaetae-6]
MQNLKSFQFAYFGPEQVQIMESFLQDYLLELGKTSLFLSLTQIIDEIGYNATRANLKRIFFQLRNLDLESQNDYQKGMEDFPKTVHENQQQYAQLAEQMGFFVRIEMYQQDDFLFITITNNCELLPVEKSRISEKFEKANEYENIHDLMLKNIDSTEGSGFGLILIRLMLKKLGMGSDSIKFHSEPGKTYFKLRLPLLGPDDEEKNFIADIITEEIDHIPQIPEHILQLETILENASSDFKDICHIIEKDPALISDLLRTVNSASYSLPKKIANITDAIKILGFKGIKNMILGYSIKHLLLEHFSAQHVMEIMNHSQEVAFYGFTLARHFHLKKWLDDIYLAAILHDIGKIMVKGLQEPQVREKLRKFCLKRGIRLEILENLQHGYKHFIIGAKIAEKWNFPPQFVQAIRYHHTPFTAPAEYTELTTLIYLANIMYYYKRDEYPYEHINYKILQKLGIYDEQAWYKLTQEIFFHYDKNLQLENA